MANRNALFVLVLLILLAPVFAGTSETGDVELWFFWGEGCELCKSAAVWLDYLSSAYPDLVIRKREVWNDQEARDLFRGMMEERGKKAVWVPALILDEQVWEGFNPSLAGDIEREVEYRLSGAVFGCGGDSSHLGGSDNPPPQPSLNLGFLGTVELGNQTLLAATLLIALVDGFNPCSLWVLTVLLAMLLNTRTRVGIAAVGAVYLLVTATVYGLFIAGLFAAFTVAEQLGWVRIFVALLALGFAAVHIKDFFAFGQGLSLQIPNHFKPAIMCSGRKISLQRSLPLILVLTVIFAAGVALVELPCTAGFPVIWAGLLTEAGVDGTGFVLLLAVYLVIYLVLELALIIFALVTLRIGRLQERHGRNLKLVGGMVMAAIGVVMLVVPEGMADFTVSMIALVGALFASGLLMGFAHLRKLRQ